MSKRLCDVGSIDLSGRASVKRTRQTTVQGRKRCPGGFQKSPNPAHSSFDEFDTEVQIHAKTQTATFILPWQCRHGI